MICVCGHDCTTEGCEDSELRAHRSAIAQGLGHTAHPIGDDEHDAWLDAAYRTTATIVATATPDPSSVVRRDAVEGPGIGAAAALRGSGVASRSNKKRAPAATGALHDDSGQRSAAGEA